MNYDILRAQYCLLPHPAPYLWFSSIESPVVDVCVGGSTPAAYLDRAVRDLYVEHLTVKRNPPPDIRNRDGFNYAILEVFGKIPVSKASI